MELKTEGDFEKFMADQDASVIGKTWPCVRSTPPLIGHLNVKNVYPEFLSGFFADDKSSAQTEFLKAASALRDDYRFAHTNAEALLSSHGGE